MGFRPTPTYKQRQFFCTLLAGWTREVVTRLGGHDWQLKSKRVCCGRGYWAVNVDKQAAIQVWWGGSLMATTCYLCWGTNSTVLRCTEYYCRSTNTRLSVEEPARTPIFKELHQRVRTWKDGVEVPSRRGCEAFCSLTFVPRILNTILQYALPSCRIEWKNTQYHKWGLLMVQLQGLTNKNNFTFRPRLCTVYGCSCAVLQKPNKWTEIGLIWAGSISQWFQCLHPLLHLQAESHSSLPTQPCKQLSRLLEKANLSNSSLMAWSHKH